MATQNPFPEIADYWGSYKNWKPVNLPNGQVVYEIPGNPGYIFNPIASNASGKIVIRPNPRDAIADQEQQKELERKAQKQAEFNNSPAGQLLPAAAGTAGTIAGIYALKDTPAAVAAAAPSSGAAPAAALAPSAAPVGGVAAPVAPTAAGGQIAPAAAAPAAESVLWGSAAPGTSIGANAAAMGVLPLAGIAAGTYLGGKSAYNLYKGKEDNSIPGMIGRGSLGIATGGLSELARASGVFGQKSTRERQAEVTGRLLEQAGDDQNAINYVTGMREQFNSAPPDPSKPFFNGKYGSFGEYKQAGLNAGDLTGVEGNIETYTPQVWAGLTQEQRQAVTQANIDDGLYDSKDGGVQITDKQKALENKDKVLKGFDVGVKTGAQIAAGAPGRTTTLSPGIGLDGRPIQVRR
jgi:hypothetical protein